MYKTLSFQTYSSLSYEIEISYGLLDEIEKRVSFLKSIATRFALITDSNVLALYGERLEHSFSREELAITLFSFPAGELHKTRETKQKLEDLLFSKGFSKDTCVIALGGGVVIDIAGYLAATFCRGVPLIMIPTSLLAMVDASIGGKVGVNTAFGKNLLGAIYQPSKVWIDPSFLKTLPQEEWKNGLVEMMKHGLVASPSFFSFLQEAKEKIWNFAKDPKSIEKAIFQSCQIKKEIVEQDEKENGKRRLLNFGHTVGHAIEKLTHYQLSHGKAVAIGIGVESFIARELGFLSPDCFNQIESFFQNYEISRELCFSFSYKSFFKAMCLDKKSLKGLPRFVIISEIGKPVFFEGAYCTEVSESILKQAYQWMRYALCCNQRTLIR